MLCWDLWPWRSRGLVLHLLSDHVLASLLPVGHWGTLAYGAIAHLFALCHHVPVWLCHLRVPPSRVLGDPDLRSFRIGIRVALQQATWTRSWWVALCLRPFFDIKDFGPSTLCSHFVCGTLCAGAGPGLWEHGPLARLAYCVPVSSLCRRPLECHGH